MTDQFWKQRFGSTSCDNFYNQTVLLLLLLLLLLSYSVWTFLISTRLLLAHSTVYCMTFIE